MQKTRDLLSQLMLLRSYQRKNFDVHTREDYYDLLGRVMYGFRDLGGDFLTPKELELVMTGMLERYAFPSGRALWVMGTAWFQKPDNYHGVFNCTSRVIRTFADMAVMLDLAMMGTGTGAVFGYDKIPPINTAINLTISDLPGVDWHREAPQPDTILHQAMDHTFVLIVGDSRRGWVKAYQTVLDLTISHKGVCDLTINMGAVRPAGEPIKGFGGVSNPAGLVKMFTRLVTILNGAIGRRLNTLEQILLIDEAAAAVVAGNIRRSAGMRQGASSDKAFAAAKDNLWQQAQDGSWFIDPDRDALRMANHTRVFHQRPDFNTCLEAVRKQYFSGEGAIQFAPEAIARSNADLLNTSQRHKRFIELYCADPQKAHSFLEHLIWEKYQFVDLDELDHRMMRFGLNPCGEIPGTDFSCNLADVHLNQIHYLNFDQQIDAFDAAAIAVTTLLARNFTDPVFAQSQNWDPIVAVSITGLFDFFVNAFGVEWLRWWDAGRSQVWFCGNQNFDDFLNNILIEEFDVKELINAPTAKLFERIEQEYLSYWKNIVFTKVREICIRNGWRVPNRCTTVAPAGSKSLITGASPGWHPPKSQRYLRRMTFRRDDPLAQAARRYGCKIVPSQSCKDESGQMLTDPDHPNSVEWLVEIPISVPWADLPGVSEIDVNKFSAFAQFNFWMQVQKYYTTFNTSATIELRESEIEEVAGLIYWAIQNDDGYISTALLARTDQVFPNMPFEPITKEQFDRAVADLLSRQESDDFAALLREEDTKISTHVTQESPIECGGGQCTI